MWIGSRQCRYQGKADIVLYGNSGDMEDNKLAGEKYLWTKQDGTLEIHGKEKKSWTKAWFEHSEFPSIGQVSDSRLFLYRRIRLKNSALSGDAKPLKVERTFVQRLRCCRKTRLASKQKLSNNCR